MDVALRIREYILENFYVSDPAAVANDTLLVTTGLVDSTGMLEIVTFLEAEFGIRIEDHETTPENLESIDRITAFVDRKRPPPVA